MGRRKPQTPRIELRNGIPTADLRPWGGARYTKVYSPRAGTLATTEAEAARWSLHLLDQPQQAFEGSLPLGSAIDSYLHACSHLALTTRRNKEVVLRTRLLGAFAPSKRLASIDWPDYFERLRHEGLKLSTRHLHYRVVRAFLRHAGMPQGLQRVRLPREAKTPPRTLSLEQALEMAEPFREIALVAFSTGVRIGELLELRWEDFDEDFVRIERQRLPSGEVTLPKGGKVRRAFVLPTPLARHQNGAVCVRPDGHRHNHASLIKACNAATGSYGMHIFRHSYSRAFLAQPGTSLHMLQEMLGHLKLSTTESHYKHFAVTDALRLARAAFSAQIAEPIA